MSFEGTTFCRCSSTQDSEQSQPLGQVSYAVAACIAFCYVYAEVLILTIHTHAVLHVAGAHPSTGPVVN